MVGAVNGPRQVVVAGAREPLAAAEARLRGAGFVCRAARTLSAFHSPVVAEASKQGLPLLRGLRLHKPRFPLYSGYTAEPLTARQAVDPEFWAGQPAAPVYFAAALDRVLAAGPALLIEAGPGQGLTMLAKRHRGVAAGQSTAVALLPARPASGEVEADSVRAVRRMLETAGAGGRP